MDTKLTSIHFNRKVLTKLLDIDPFCSSFFWHYYISFPYNILGHQSHMSQSFFSYSCWWLRCYLDVMVAVSKNVTWQLLSLCVCLSQSWILYLIVNSCRVSYVNSDSHQMCTISLKYCSTVIPTLYFRKCLCHVLWHFNTFRNFQYWKIVFAYFQDQKNLHFEFLLEKKTNSVKPVLPSNHN